MTPVDSAVTFTNDRGEALGPLLLWLRGLGFFEWYLMISTGGLWAGQWFTKEALR